MADNTRLGESGDSFGWMGVVGGRHGSNRSGDYVSQLLQVAKGRATCYIQLCNSAVGYSFCFETMAMCYVSMHCAGLCEHRPLYHDHASWKGWHSDICSALSLNDIAD